ncbi:hypothetical protein [Hymenobacter sp. BT730]|uniref:hypothetical protein n=1 Tax=Hymenobacter sp. BT730 TaxID=3063332 RepID=UPI0026DF3A99|nr:hypothetical protein [Hymenobacter sp. BT730]
MLRYLYALSAVIFLSFCFSLSSGFSQTIQPGYYVRAAGDTVRGDLENAYWQDAPAIIRFRPQGQMALQTLRTRSLLGFGLHNLRNWRTQYLTYDAAAESNPAYLQTDAPRTRFVKDTLVTEVLVEGPITLLAAFQGTTPHYFLLYQEQTPLELVDRRYQYTGPDGRRYLSRVNDYREQLRAFLPACPEVESRISKLPYDEKAIIRLVQQYNTTCLGQPMAATQHNDEKPKGQNRVRLDWGVQTGAAYASTTAHSEKPDAEPGTVYSSTQGYDLIAVEMQYLKNERLESSLRPLAGLYADILFPGRHFALHTEGSYRTMQRYQKEFTSGQAGYPRKMYRLSGNQITAQLGFRMLRPLQTGQLLAGAGITMAFTSLRENEAAYPGATNLTYKGINLPRRNRLTYPYQQVGLYVEAGYRWKRFTSTISWRYQEGLLEDRTAVESIVIAQPSNTFIDVIHTEYNLRSHLGVINIAYRLNRNTDQ